MSNQTTIISLGGSMIAPQSVDTDFLKSFRALILKWLDAQPGRRVILITGGGAPARIYQEACRAILPSADNAAQDWIGIMATRLNGQLVKAVFDTECREDVVTDPTAPLAFTGRVLVAAGWKPGFSTDFDAVLLAEKFAGDTVINLSNIAKVYTDDPKKDPNAKPIDDIAWPEFRKIVGDDWVPGKNTPFDPIATKKAAELGLKVAVAAGKDLPNLEKILNGQTFFGTLIHP